MKGLLLGKQDKAGGIACHVLSEGSLLAWRLHGGRRCLGLAFAQPVLQPFSCKGHSAAYFPKCACSPLHSDSLQLSILRIFARILEHETRQFFVQNLLVYWIRVFYGSGLAWEDEICHSHSQGFVHHRARLCLQDFFLLTIPGYSRP